MSGIPAMKCPRCGAPMEYRGGPSDSNIFIMSCTKEGCRYQGTYYAEEPRRKELKTCECGGKLVGGEGITPLTDDNVMSWHRLWGDIDEEVGKGGKFCETCHRVYSYAELVPH